jgi:sugar lactone lactonase YvrE
VDQAGNIYIADYSNARIRKVDIHGTITTFAGNGQYADSGDGGPATSAAFRELKNVSVDSQGNVFVVTALTVRRIDTNGNITTIAGDPSCTGGGFRGDGGPAPQACLYAPSGVAGSASLLYIADELNYRIREVDKNGTISTFAGNGSNGFTASGGPASQVAIGLATGIATDATGNVFFSDCLNQQISMISLGTLTMIPVAGTGVAGFSGDNGAPNQAQLSCPTNLAIGPDGALYVLDSSNLRIRRIVLVP